MAKKSSSKEYIDALAKISKVITSNLYLEDILKLIVSVSASILRAKICALWLVDEKTQELSIRATQAMSREYLKNRTIKVGEGIVGLTASAKKTIIIDDVTKDDRYKEKELAKKENFVSMISVPMMIKDKVVGVMNCYTTEHHEFTKNDVEVFEAVTNQAAVAIENAELMIKTRIIQEELETRKKVEKAKGILMREQNMSEDKAYNLLRKSSMDKRVSMKDIAEAIILTFEIKEK